MPIALDRSMCCNPGVVIEREWLVTNKIGGYAAGTVAGVLTRPEHGLLVICPPGTSTRQLLFAKMDEEVSFNQKTYYLGTNEYRDGTLNPAGFVHLERFQLENGFPIFTYHLGGSNGIQLEKRIWMPQDQNTTYVQYRILSTTDKAEGYRYRCNGLHSAAEQGFKHLIEEQDPWQPAITLTVLPFATCRPYNTCLHEQHQLHFEVETYHAGQQIASYSAEITGCTITASTKTGPYHLLAIGHTAHPPVFIPTGVWYWNFLHRHERQEAQPAYDNLYLPGVIRATLQANEESTLTLLISTEKSSNLPQRQEQVQRTYKRTLEQQKKGQEKVLQPQRYFGDSGEAIQAERLPILPLYNSADPYCSGKEFLHLLLQASEHFIIYQAKKSRKDSHCIHSPLAELVPVIYTGYFQMSTETRETLLALPGLTLIPERYSEAQQILRGIAHHFKNGLLPDRLPPPGEDAIEESYNNADCTLWYFYALDHYLCATQDQAFLRELYPYLKDAIHRYKHGTDNGIRADPCDGLLRAEQPGKALTWMNVHVQGHFVTPRMGKAVEINALWQHALYLMLHWTRQNEQIGHFGYAISYYQDLLLQCQQSFQKRFWYAPGGYLYDVIDGPQGNDASLRPNQIMALALRSSQLEERQQRSIFEIITEQLLTPYGLRTLSPQDPAYRGRRGENYEEQQKALHQGSIWSWFIGPYSEALIVLHHPRNQHTGSQNEDLRKEFLWRKALRLLEPFTERLNNELLGMCGSVLSGDYPHQPGTEVASATATAELLRVYNLFAQMRISHPESALYT